MKITTHKDFTGDLFSGRPVFEELKNNPDYNAVLCEVYNGWPGQTGLQRVQNVVDLLEDRIPQYARIAGKSHAAMLKLFCEKRNVNYTNYFQDENFPDISAVLVFKNLEEFRERFPSGIYLCPYCKGSSKSPYRCDSGIKVSGKICNWKVYGLLGGLGNEVKLLFLDRMDEIPRPESIFRPIEMNNEKQD